MSPKRVDSDALGILNQALGLTGAGSPITELQDGVVDQGLDVAPIVRRSRTQAATDGIYTAVLRNEHGASGALSSSIRPYDVENAAEVAPYPRQMPRQFDIWILDATCRRTAGSGTLVGGLFIRYPISQQGWGIDDGDSAVALLSIVPVAIWNIVFSTGGTLPCTSTSHLLGLQGNGIRLPRQRQLALVFETDAAALATFVCDVTLGVFPVSLGQDGRV